MSVNELPFAGIKVLDLDTNEYETIYNKLSFLEAFNQEHQCKRMQVYKLALPLAR